MERWALVAEGSTPLEGGPYRSLDQPRCPGIGPIGASGSAAR